MKTKLLCAIGVAILLYSAHATASDVAGGETIYQSVCKNCHGPTAKGMASFPKLAGQPADYLETRLKQYRAGEKVGFNTALMRPLAAELTDEEIKNIAAYISSTFE